MSHLRAFFCREYRDYALFGVEFLAEICQKFSEILRILAEILRKKLATGASDGGYECISLISYQVDADLDGPGGKLDSNGGLGLQVELIPCEPGQ